MGLTAFLAPAAADVGRSPAVQSRTAFLGRLPDPLAEVFPYVDPIGFLAVHAAAFVLGVHRPGTVARDSHSFFLIEARMDTALVSHS